MSKATIAIGAILIVLGCYGWVKGADAYAKMP